MLHSTDLVSLIDEIWVWEAIQHGDAAIINEPSATGICKIHLKFFLLCFFLLMIFPVDWTDDSRDIVNFLINFLPTTAVDAPLPTHLPRTPSQEAELRLKNGFKDRTIVAAGHSMGGCTSYGQFVHRLFSSCLLIIGCLTQSACGLCFSCSVLRSYSA